MGFLGSIAPHVPDHAFRNMGERSCAADTRRPKRRPNGSRNPSDGPPDPLWGPRAAVFRVYCAVTSRSLEIPYCSMGLRDITPKARPFRPKRPPGTPKDPSRGPPPDFHEDPKQAVSKASRFEPRREPPPETSLAREFPMFQKRQKCMFRKRASGTWEGRRPRRPRRQNPPLQRPGCGRN